jgi:hypothetical protein
MNYTIYSLYRYTMQLSDQSYFYITLFSIILACMCVSMMVCIRYHDRIRQLCCTSSRVTPETGYVVDVQLPTPELK